MNQLEKCPNCGTQLMPKPQEMRELRTRTGLSQRALAEKLGVKSSYIAYLESGRRHPSGDFIQKTLVTKDQK